MHPLQAPAAPPFLEACCHMLRHAAALRGIRRVRPGSRGASTTTQAGLGRTRQHITPGRGCQQPEPGERGRCTPNRGPLGHQSSHCSMHTTQCNPDSNPRYGRKHSSRTLRPQRHVIGSDSSVKIGVRRHAAACVETLTCMARKPSAAACRSRRCLISRTAHFFPEQPSPCVPCPCTPAPVFQ